VEVILLDRVANLGNLGAKVKVRPGFGRNYLIPQGKALPATKGNLERFEAQKAQLEQAALDRLERAKQRAQTFENLSLKIAANTGEEGKLFGSVGVYEIVNAMTNLGHTITKSEVQLPLGPFRQVGEYEVELHLHGSDIVQKIKVLIVSA
jgi:large subunit ribosomal protein L9